VVRLVVRTKEGPLLGGDLFGPRGGQAEEGSFELLGEGLLVGDRCVYDVDFCSDSMLKRTRTS
jgi:hypothetical protein